MERRGRNGLETAKNTPKPLPTVATGYGTERMEEVDLRRPARWPAAVRLSSAATESHQPRINEPALNPPLRPYASAGDRTRRPRSQERVP
jgi:hypothetical protein